MKPRTNGPYGDAYEGILVNPAGRWPWPALLAAAALAVLLSWL